MPFLLDRPVFVRRKSVTVEQAKAIKLTLNQNKGYLFKMNKVNHITHLLDFISGPGAVQIAWCSMRHSSQFECLT